MAAHASENTIISNYLDDNHMNKMRDFVKYLKQNQIEHKKNKNGMPDMRYVENKTYFRQFLSEQLEQLNTKNVTIRRKKTTSRRLEFDALEKAQQASLQDKIKTYNCVICMEDISTNICVLECKHAFCVSCFANHMRESGNCPLCRSKVVEKPKKAEKMPDESIYQNMMHQVMASYPERNDMTLPQFIKECCNYHFPQEHENHEAFMKAVMNEVQEFGIDVGHQIAEWYNSNI